MASNPFYQGAALVLADLAREHDLPSVAADICRRWGITVAILEGSGVIAYDVAVIKKALDENPAQAPTRSVADEFLDGVTARFTFDPARASAPGGRRRGRGRGGRGMRTLTPYERSERIALTEHHPYTPAVYQQPDGGMDDGCKVCGLPFRAHDHTFGWDYDWAMEFAGAGGREERGR